MQKLSTNTVGIDSGSVLLFSDFKDNGVMWTGEGPRELRHLVIFDEPFKAAPVVQVGMSMWDVDHKTNQRVDISADEIGTEGFTIVFRTWGDTRIARIRADWLAIGEAFAEDDWHIY